MAKKIMDRRTFFYHSGALLSSFGLRALGGGVGLSALSFLNAKDFQASAPKIGYLPITDHLVVIAKELQNANFTPLKFSSWADLSEALRAGAIDGAFILTPLALKLKSQGVAIKALFATHRNGSALVVKKGLLQNTDENTKHDPTLLRGKKIAIPSRFSTHYLLLGELLAQANLSPKDVNLIDMAPPEMLSALSNGSIDGFIVAEPFCFAAQTRKLADVFALSKDISNNHICCVLALNENLIATRANEVQALSEAFLQTAHFIKENPAKAAELSKKFLGQKVELIASLLAQDRRVVYENLKLTQNDLDKTLKDIKRFEVGAFDVGFEEFVDSRFVDAVLARNQK
ncbi:twin-arginine translocation pathway signal protein [Helicobacter sp. MIT 00-7814]|uniref:ABC transporter substrate-binding protein n=1 Tax=unclassified Helicobacter TaxID=2593540 RepID=UPI000E1EDA98|nr:MULTISPECIES: ABC transporter substrate-binding protein [unclassified Helicobacter]RDU55486.1 twin-arginine translocation pathway signal protein [Helicobacter sp. MIT 99-10781]RDU55575.1 twin-arginine translocation pathway signal protein [Helicobacter sp. MIT 00-7814]